MGDWLSSRNTGIDDAVTECRRGGARYYSPSAIVRERERERELKDFCLRGIPGTIYLVLVLSSGYTSTNLTVRMQVCAKYLRVYYRSTVVLVPPPPTRMAKLALRIYLFFLNLYIKRELRGRNSKVNDSFVFVKCPFCPAFSLVIVVCGVINSKKKKRW